MVEVVAVQLTVQGRPPHPHDVARQVGRLDGVRVLFVNVPVREAAVPNNAPLGPALLAARLEALGAECAILDLNARRPVYSDEQARAELSMVMAARRPHMVGLSGLITTLAWQTKVARWVREMDRDVWLVSGGGLATQFRAGLFGWIPELDAVAHSEGDDVIVKAAADAWQVHQRGRAGARNRGLLDPYDTDAGVVYGGDRPPDLDALPLPAWHLLPGDVLDRYISAPVWGGAAKNSSDTPFTMTRSMNTVSSRGCPFSCRFCFRGAQGERNYGVRSARSMADEFRWLVSEHGVDFVGVVDDNCMVQPKRLAEMAEMLPGVRWGTHGRLDEACDSRVDDMARGGCVYIGFGAESASPRTLEAMGKGGMMLKRGTARIDGYDLPTTMVEGVRNTHRAGIHGNTTWIMGYPGETLDDLKHTVTFILWQSREVGVVNRSLFVATAYPGTEMFKAPRCQEMLSDRFGLRFHADGSPVIDEALRRYVLELNDATKLLTGDDGEPLNFGAMPDDRFLEARAYVESGEIERILDM